MMIEPQLASQVPLVNPVGGFTDLHVQLSTVLRTSQNCSSKVANGHAPADNWQDDTFQFRPGILREAPGARIDRKKCNC